MKTRSVFVFSVSCLLLACSAIVFGQAQTPMPAAASAAGITVPRLVSFSGVVNDGAGKPVTGRVAVMFSLYAEQDGGTPLWSETQVVQADTQGHYTVFLGATEPKGLPLDAFTSGAARWLGVQPEVTGTVELPRILLVGVPYALKAADADTLGGKPASAFVTTDLQSPPGAPAGVAPAHSAAETNSAAQPAVSPAAVGGSGSANFIPLWLNSTTLGNSAFFQMAGNVGLGTMTPDAKLEAISIMSAGIGVHGAASGTSGAGVKGAATATSGSTYGVIGADASSSGVGVFGNATAASGSTIGVQGHATSPAGVGVQGGGGSSSADGGTAGVGGSFRGGAATGAGSFGGKGVVINGGNGVFGGGLAISATGGAPAGELDGEHGGDGIDSQGGPSYTFDSVGGYGVSAFGGGGGTGGGVGVSAQGGSGALGGPGVFATGGNGGALNGGDGIDAIAGSGSPNGLAGSFTGDVSVSGNLTVSGTKHFKIDHPLDPANKYLYHASVESSEVTNLYRGNVTLDGSGRAVVQLPDWFEAINKDFSYQLTAVGAPAPGLYVAQEIQSHSFRIAGGPAGIKVSWQVTAARQDAWEKAHPMVVEAEKPAREQGYYLNPELFGAPEEKGIEWARNPEAMQRLKTAREKQVRQASSSAQQSQKQ